MNFLILSDRGLGPSPPELLPEKVPVFTCQPRALRSQLQRGFYSQLGLVEPRAG